MFAFLKSKPPAVSSTALKPSTLKNWESKKKESSKTVSSSSNVKSTAVRSEQSRAIAEGSPSVFNDDPEVIKPLRHFASQLPTSVPEGQSDGLLAPSAVKPTLNNLIGYGKKPEELIPLIQQGKLGINSLIEWIKSLILDGEIQETLIQLKLTNLLLAMKSLISDSANVIVVRPVRTTGNNSDMGFGLQL
ncbi:hypothetical protein M422DRAFT_247102 [Sphaerobolus stellatus SS14]|nr:hypothetical protein M422DRAFT_247102 [Sphaerobolus stellatus SS14]